MKINFDEVINRNHTNSLKWDGVKQFYDREDVIPLWVADMDFKCAPEILEAFQERINHGIVGYTCKDENYYDAIISWFNVRHGWAIKQGSLTFAPPGVIFAINILIEILSEIGDKIIIQTPNYNSLIDAINLNDRIIVENPLIINDGKYKIDFDGFKKLIDNNTKILIISNPHNPTGRVWDYSELKEIAEICAENNVLIISDDIHCDMIYKPNKYIPIASISYQIGQNSIVCTSTNKTFNLGGLQLATLVIENQEIREKFNNTMYKYQTRLDNVFGAIALEVAYKKCGYWVDEVMDYIHDNFNALKKYIEEKLPELTLFEPEGTYFAWIDFSKLNLGEELMDFLVNDAKVAFTSGVEFSGDCNGFMRINLACRREILLKAFENIYNKVN